MDKIYYFEVVCDTFNEDGTIQDCLSLLNQYGLIPDGRSPSDGYGRFGKVKTMVDIIANKKNIYKHTDLEIDIESIEKYLDLKSDLLRCTYTPSFYYINHNNQDFINDILHSKKDRMNNIIQYISFIKIEWVKKYNTFMAWKRRRQVIAAWHRL